MSGPFKMRGWSPFTQKPGKKEYEQYKKRPDIKRNDLLEQIEFIEEDAHASESGELTDAQKQKIAALRKQISQIPE
tara:strand:- start:630 stop:857 length:228 start_codon:yes stop_codon:yes gene_type:complete